MSCQNVSHFVQARLRSFRCAFAGLAHLLRTQRNAQIHAVATLLVATTATILKLSVYEWCWLIAAIGAVWTAEALNTALELVCDVACPQFHPQIGHAKDVAAGAVLLTAIAAAAIAACIFLPHLHP